MLREWRITYQEELAQVRAEEKKAIVKAVGKVKGKGKMKAKERAAAKAAVKAAMKAVYESMEQPSVSGIYRRYLEHIPNVILVRTFRAWVGRGYRLAALAGGGELSLQFRRSRTKPWYILGSPYFIMLMAGRKMCYQVGSAPWASIRMVCNALHQ